MQDSLNILIVGATGHLGSRVVREALNRPNLVVNILVRDQEHNHDICDEVGKAGGRVIKGDVMNPNSINGATKGIHTVISCLQDEHKCLFDGQMNLLNDCIKNGVQRFVPSDFSVNYTKIQSQEHPFMEYKKRFRDELNKTNIKSLHINFGLIMENFLDHQINGLHYWQNKNQLLSLTCYDDAAKFIVEAISDPNRTGQLNFVSAQLRVPDIAHIIHKVKGDTVELLSAGSFDDLRKQIKSHEEKGEMIESSYLENILVMFDGRGQLDNIDNDSFSNVKPTSFEEFLKNHPEALKIYNVE